MRRDYSQHGLYLLWSRDNVITQNDHVLTHTRFLGANVKKVNDAGFSTKKEMEVFIWCTLDWSPMHSFAARYFSYIIISWRLIICQVLVSYWWISIFFFYHLISDIFTHCLNFTILVSHNISLKACVTREDGRVSISPFPSRWYQPGLHHST